MRDAPTPDWRPVDEPNVSGERTARFYSRTNTVSRLADERVPRRNVYAGNGAEPSADPVTLKKKRPEK